MDILQRNYLEPCCDTKVCEPVTIPERLFARKRALELDLKEINEALEVLEKNPQVTEVLHALSKVRG
jgi:hypothetical protein